jgi:hypothetical protein
MTGVRQVHHATSSLPHGELHHPLRDALRECYARCKACRMRWGDRHCAEPFDTLRTGSAKCPIRKTGDLPGAFCLFLDFYRDGSYNHDEIQVGFLFVGDQWEIIGRGKSYASRPFLETFIIRRLIGTLTGSRLVKT